MTRGQGHPTHRRQLRSLPASARLPWDARLPRRNALGRFGELAELFVSKETFELYACSRCGHVEFFVEGVGDELRRPLEQ